MVSITYMYMYIYNVQHIHIYPQHVAVHVVVHVHVHLHDNLLYARNLYMLHVTMYMYCYNNYNNIIASKHAVHYSLLPRPRPPIHVEGRGLVGVVALLGFLAFF